MTEEEFYVNMMSLDVGDDLRKDIEDIMDDEDKEVSDENTPVRLRKKYRDTINDLFTEKCLTCDDLFGLAFLLINQFNINPESFIMCLDKENKHKLRTYASNKFNTSYHKKKEKEKKNKGKETYGTETVNIKRLFRC